jgi:hypothetical protein
MPAGTRLAPMLDELVAILRRFGPLQSQLTNYLYIHRLLSDALAALTDAEADPSDNPSAVA